MRTRGASHITAKFLQLPALVLGLWLALALAVAARAQDGAPPGDAKGTPYVLLHADEVTYNENTGDVIAKGNVEIAHGGYVLRADTVTYNDRRDTVSATDNVILLQPTGEVVFSDRADLSDGMKEGISRRFRMLLTDDSRLTAAVATRTGGRIHTLNSALFSPCKLCEENPEAAPLWRIRSARSTHDAEEKEIEHRDAFLEFYGIPVFYTPFFSHPDPSVRRRSGFLAPSYSSDSDFGFTLETPYFWVIDETSDLTVAPRFMTDDANLYQGVYRKRFANAKFDVDASFTQPERTDANGNRIGGSETRGHLFLDGELEHDNIWRSRLQIRHATDDTFLRRYRFPTPDNQTLVSKVNTEGFFGRNYAQLSAYSFQGLREDDDPAESPLVLPFAEYRFVSQPAANGAYVTADASALAITRDLGTDTRRLALNTGWHLPHTSDSGAVYELSAMLRTDFYSSNDVTTATGARTDATTGRVFPQVKAEVRYPFARSDQNSTQIIEPIAAVILAPNGGNPDKIPNEDSAAPDLDTTNLFSANRFGGVDRIESGHRVVYGLNWNLYGTNGGVVELFLGQSYRLREQREFSDASGLRSNSSDVVGRVRVAPSEWIDLLYRFRYDSGSFKAQRNELSGSVGPARLKLWANYLFLEEDSNNPEFDDREELTVGFSARLSPQWSLSGSWQENLADNGGTISESLALSYADECFVFRVVGTRNFTQDRDLRPTDTLLFQLVFKHLGEFSSSG